MQLFAYGSHYANICSDEKEMRLYSLYNQCLHNISACHFLIPRLDAFLLLSELQNS